MAGRLFRKPEWETFVREELYQLFVSLIFVIAIGAGISLACSVTCAVTKDTNPFDTALNYLSDMRTEIDVRADKALTYGKDLRIFTAVHESYGEVMYNLYSGCGVIAATQETLVSILSAFIGAVIAQQYALMFIPALAMQFLLPFAVILRIIPLTRKSSALLMALAFALYVVFPLTYVLAKKIAEDPSVENILKREGEIGNLQSEADCEEPILLLRNIKRTGYYIPFVVFIPALSTIFTTTTAMALSRVFEYEFR